MGTSVEMLERFYGHVFTSLVAKEITKTKRETAQNTVRTNDTNDYSFERSSQLTTNRNMIMDEMSLTKGQMRKLNALKKSIGDDLGTDAFTKWMSNQEKEKSKGVKVDPVAVKLQEVLSHLESDQSVRLGNKGYTIKRARGKNAFGFIVTKN